MLTLMRVAFGDTMNSAETRYEHHTEHERRQLCMDLASRDAPAEWSKQHAILGLAS
jgi:hypothetical protein